MDKKNLEKSIKFKLKKLQFEMLKGDIPEVSISMDKGLGKKGRRKELAPLDEKKT